MAIKKKVAPTKAAPKTKATVKKVATLKAAVKTPVVKKAVPEIKPETNQSAHIGQAISDGTRYKMVADATYFHAEKENFLGDNVEHWLKAEADIDALLKNK